MCGGTSRCDAAHAAQDGVKWTKPRLGLVDYNGSKANNLVKFTGNPEPDTFLAAGIIFYDPDEKLAAKRFKMIWENHGMNKALHSGESKPPSSQNKPPFVCSAWVILGVHVCQDGLVDTRV